MVTEKARRSSIPGGVGAGVGAAIAMMLVMALFRFTTNTISIPELMENSLTHLTGGQVEAFFINNLGVGGKALLLVTIVEGTLILGGLLGWLFTRFWPLNNTNPSWRWTSGLLYGLLVGLLLNAVFLPIVGQGFFGSSAVGATAPPDIARALYGSNLAPFGLPVFLSIFILSLVFGLALVYLLPWTQYVSKTVPVAIHAAPAGADVPSQSRRDFTKALGGGVLALIGGAALWAVIRQALQPPPNAQLQAVDTTAPPPTSLPGTTPPPATTPAPTAPVTADFANVKALLVPEITPTDSFYITTKNFIDPTVDGNAWHLTFKGLVDNPYTVNLKDIMAMTSVVTRPETLACISNPIGGSLIGNANWKGVDFAQMLNKAKPRSNATKVIVRAADGYEDSFPLDVALKNGVVLAYEMNGQSLVSKHGYPTRLLVPNIYGMKNCKWLTEVELTDQNFMGYWESQGWDDVAHYQIVSRIDYPNTESIDAKPLYIGGIAFAGNRGIKRVEVTTDGGNSWADAQLRPAMGPFTWVQWTFPWNPKAGVYTIQVRATDGAGAIQPSERQDTYPSGATGYHTVAVRVG